ncbi:MAG: topoisomerase C-terminal repeat-containing protein [Clostridia bacterium]|nr:topoisomerase C-terminal repeat-containing protein [Clostridia bacterium]
MILIIAEKPSLGRNIAAGIETLPNVRPLNKRQGYLEGDGYLVTWAFGHLFSLCDIEAYTGVPDSGTLKNGKPRWTMSNLPCFPDSFRFELRKSDKSDKPDEGVIKQFNCIRNLCNRPDVDCIVNAGDADREGEIIVRLCIQHALQTGKPVKRLWLPDQTPETVAQALSDLKDDSEYDSLANEGFARTYIDWLYGVNLTRYATLKSGKLLRVGRVIIPIVKAIYDRDKEISEFVPGKYLAILSKEKTNGETVELLSKTKFDEPDKAKAEELCRTYNDAGAVVTAVKSKKDKLMPGKLYSLSKLQNVLSKRFKMSMTQSLAIVQKLYEAGYLTYPRTDSEYMATAEKGKVRSILGQLSNIGYPVRFKDSKVIFDDSKIESHSAITPTYKIPQKDKLSPDEYKVYSTVLHRFVAVFCSEDCVVSKKEISIAVGDPKDPLETFTLKGTVIVEKGWTKFDEPSVKDKILPALSQGDPVNILFKPVQKETTPPKHYTVETLNNYLKNPFREEKQQASEKSQDPQDASEEDRIGADDTEDYRAIFEGLELGTEATRTGIIDNARTSKYINLKGDTYTILDDGKYLIEFLSRLQISMDKYKTSQLGQALKKVYRGLMTISDSVKMAESEIAEVFARESEDSEDRTGMFKDIVGTCPICGKSVRSYGRFYGCEGYADGCPLKINTQICGKTISVPILKTLLENGKTELLKGFRSKKGNSFEAVLELKDGKPEFVFPDRPERKPKEPAEQKPEKAASGKAGKARKPSSRKKPEPTPVCPICGKPILKGRTAYGCEGWKDGCTFRVPFVSDRDEDNIRALKEELSKSKS